MRTKIDPSHSLASRAVFALTLGLIVWIPLPWASHRTWSSDLLVVLASVLLAAQLALIAIGQAHPAAQLRRLLPGPLLWWLAWLLLVGAALLPMDLSRLEALSPAAAEIYRQASAILGTEVTPRLGISIAATGDGVLLTWGYACLYFLVLLSCAEDRSRQRLMLGAVVVSGVLQATYAGLMLLSGLEWGFLAEKEAYRGLATGTFVNRNHLAHYMALSGAAALTLILADLGPGRRGEGIRNRLLDFIDLLFSAKMRSRLALVILVIALILTRSRMGNIAFFVSLSAAGLCFILLRHRRYALRAMLLFASIAAVDVLIVSNWYGLELVVDRIEQTDLQTDNRAALLRDAAETAATYSFTGAGLGSFSRAHTPYRSAASVIYFDHAHNDYVQFLVETGFAGLIMLALFVGAHALHAIRVLLARRSPLPAAIAIGALMAMTAEALHATTDFNLQIPANAATLLVLLALSAGNSAHSRARNVRHPQDDAAVKIPYTQAGS